MSVRSESGSPTTNAGCEAEIPRSIWRASASGTFRDDLAREMEFVTLSASRMTSARGSWRASESSCSEPT